MNKTLDTEQFVACGQTMLRFSMKTWPPDLVKTGQVPFY